jgi:VWFA-related protein
LRKTIDEVAVFFAATDRGKSITNLGREDIKILDNGSPPPTITEFRNESQLPLRVGLLIDTSASITKRFSFEQEAASDFLRSVLTSEDDLGFVVGFSNSILLVQDFTNDKPSISHAIEQLVPAGGTALWDAVAFAADKLSERKENRPVAKILVVVSDGDDNSSTDSVKAAIETAERDETIVYTVSTREIAPGDDLASVGNHAVRLLAQRTGGAAFFPGSIGHLRHSLAEVQEVMRSRYLVSYKPTFFEQHGQFRTIDITAQKSGRRLRVYARKGYYARENGTSENAISR